MSLKENATSLLQKQYTYTSLATERERERERRGQTDRQTAREGKKTLSHKFLISNFCHVLNVVFFLLGDSPATEFYVLTLQNILSVPSSKVVQAGIFLLTPPMKMELSVCSEMSAH